MKPEDRPPSTAPVAVIDIGSNSVRLVVYEGLKRVPATLFNEKVLCGLGRSLASTGALDEESVDRALSALRRFRAVTDLLGASDLHVIATAAAREASNGPDFIKQAERICGVEIAVLSGRKEAKLAASGVIAGSYKVDGLAADLGGGSLEIIDIRKQKLVGGATLPLGGLRLIDMSGGNLKKAAKFIDKSLNKVDWLGAGEGRPFYGVGGTWRAFARLHMAQTAYPLSMMHGYAIPALEALTFAELLDRLSPSTLDGIAAISKARRETIPFGALVLAALLARIRPSHFVISAFGVREGIIYRELPGEERRRDPLIAACAELAQQRARSTEHAWELCEWTEALFDDPEQPESAQERRLREAACLLSDIGWRAHPDYRGDKSLNLIAHSDFAGIDHPGRAFLALSIYYRHEGLINEDLSPRLIELVDERALRRARAVGAAIRAAHMISASTAGVIPHTPALRQKGRLVLHLPEPYAVLGGERLERRFAALASELGLEPDIRTGQQAVPDAEPVTA